MSIKKIAASVVLMSTILSAGSAFAFGHGPSFRDMHRGRPSIRMEYQKHKMMSRIRHREDLHRHIMRKNMNRGRW